MLAASIFFGVVVHAAAGPNIIKTPTLNGLVGYWSFNSADVSGTKAFDRSGGGNNATLVNAPTIVKGALGQALSLNGSNQYVSIANSMDLSTGATWSMWVKLASLSQNASFFSKRDGGSTSDWQIYTDSAGRLEIHLFANGGFFQTDSNYFTAANQWVLVTVTYDGTTLKVYRNGVLYTSFTQVGTLSDRSLATRLGNDWFTYYANASFDDVRIYNRALSANEINALMSAYSTNITTVQQSSNATGLMALWSFDGADMSTTTAFDRSGNGNNGTLINTPQLAIGKKGQALQFNGSNQYIDVGSAIAPGTISIAAWVKLNAYTPDAYFVSTGSSVSDGYHFGTYNGAGSNNFAWFFGAGSGILYSTTVPTLGKWYHVVATYDGTNQKIYVNGVLENTRGSAGYRAPSITTKIARRGQGTNFINGTLDDVRIYNRALSAAEVQSLSANQFAVSHGGPLTSVEALVVAGGGGGSTSGGGGAGGLIYTTGISLASGNYPVTIGNGGAGSSSLSGSNGATTTFYTFTAIGGGGGAGANVNTANSGGSGGGSGNNQFINQHMTGGSGVAGQGNAGGSSPGYGCSPGGGGGGSGSAGADATSGRGGNGGNGTSISITGTATYYAGGGGGGSWCTAVGTGGLGGGGNAGNPGQNATGYGSGGGGGGNASSNVLGGTGSAGVVIIAYPGTVAKATGGTISTSSRPGYVVHTFTISGTFHVN